MYFWLGYNKLPALKVSKKGLDILSNCSAFFSDFFFFLISTQLCNTCDINVVQLLKQTLRSGIEKKKAYTRIVLSRNMSNWKETELLDFESKALKWIFEMTFENKITNMKILPKLMSINIVIKHKVWKLIYQYSTWKSIHCQYQIPHV